MSYLGVLTLLCVLSAAAPPASGEQRIPPPDFRTTNHTIPTPQHPDQHRPLLPDPPRAEGQSGWSLYDYLGYVDVGVLAAALAVGAILSLRTRRRRWIFAMGLFSLAYFGFWRMGCVCPIGATQNVALALADPSYAIPIVVVAFFVLPIVATLLFGRTFCGSVCPLGAIQDLVLLAPIRLPAWLDQPLRVLPYGYLDLAVLLAATGGVFAICQYDPFVGFFRLSAPTTMLVLGAAVLAIGVFVGRPYCRFACPYGLILSWASRVSWWRARITPADCIHCRLCEPSCPFNAIDVPTVGPQPTRTQGKWALAAMLALTPILAAAGAVAGGQLGGPLAWTHRTVRMAEILKQKELDTLTTTPNELEAFARQNGQVVDVYRDAQRIVKQYRIGAAVAGGLMGLAMGGRLIGLSLRRRRRDYTPNRAACLACGRCYERCPVEMARRTGKPLVGRRSE